VPNSLLSHNDKSDESNDELFILISQRNPELEEECKHETLQQPWMQKALSWKTMMKSKGSITSFTEHKREIFESSIFSILAYLQVNIDLGKIKSTIEDNYLKAR
jgi:hypothetical protein